MSRSPDRHLLNPGLLDRPAATQRRYEAKPRESQSRGLRLRFIRERRPISFPGEPRSERPPRGLLPLTFFCKGKGGRNVKQKKIKDRTSRWGALSAIFETVDRLDDRELGTSTPRNGPLDGRAGSALVLRAPTLEREHKGRPGLPREPRSITALPVTR